MSRNWIKPNMTACSHAHPAPRLTACQPLACTRTPATRFGPLTYLTLPHLPSCVRAEWTACMRSLGSIYTRAHKWGMPCECKKRKLARSLCSSMCACLCVPSPTLSPTDPVPRGLLTLCPGASSGPYTAYIPHTYRVRAYVRACVCVYVCVCVCLCVREAFEDSTNVRPTMRACPATQCPNTYMHTHALYAELT